MARRRPLSPSGELLLSALRAEKERGFSGRTIAERFGLKSESTVRDYLSGRRQPIARDAERAIANYNEAVNAPRLVLSRERGLIPGEPLDRKSWSTLGRYDRAVRLAREAGDWSIVEKETRGRNTIRTDAGTVTLETRPEMLREANDAGVYTGRQQKYRSPKKSEKPARRRSRPSRLRASRRGASS
jgi:transcriptional regulator with XRE-family HTH domain